MVQNVYLECAALGLGSCVYALVRFDNVRELLGLKNNQILRIAQAVGEVRD
jgi:nitroreductase